MAPITFAICGCGNRGLEVYAAYQNAHPERMKVVAGADCRPGRLARLRELYGVEEALCFDSDEALLAQPRLADVLIIATQDRRHVPAALKALDKGYDILLEKPISPELGECLRLQEKAHETGRAVTVCHVLRYTPFYSRIQAMLRRGEIGRLQTIDAVEHVGWWHYAHSFVRGNWRRWEDTSPMILAKSCHDMDILRWLADAPCVKVQSFGRLGHFTADNAPPGAAPRCLDGCGCREDCLYDARRLYLDNPHCGLERGKTDFPGVVTGGAPTRAALLDALRTGPYGRCVYHCDNDVVDHQTVNLEFEGGICATFTMTAFTEEFRRTIKLTGTRGEMEGDMDANTICLRPFGGPARTIVPENVPDGPAGHGGGDAGLMRRVCALAEEGDAHGDTGIDSAVESHVMALAAEASRVGGGETIRLAEFVQAARAGAGLDG